MGFVTTLLLGPDLFMNSISFYRNLSAVELGVGSYSFGLPLVIDGNFVDSVCLGDFCLGDFYLDEGVGLFFTVGKFGVD